MRMVSQTTRYFGRHAKWMSHLAGSVAAAVAVVAAVVAATGCGPALPVGGPIDLSRVRLPAGFRISLFASELPGARLMAFSPSGVLVVSLTEEGRVMALADPERTGRASHRYALLEGVDSPHGLAFRGRDLYVAETGRVLRFPDAEGALRQGRSLGMGEAVVVVPELPQGGNHFSRTIAFGFEGELFVSVGSSCNVCEEQDQRRGAVLRFPAGGGEGEVYASGLRNAVGLRWNPQDRNLWVTENGRDWLGDDLPPEEINVIGEPGDYGWPYCYGKNVPDPEYGDAERCRETISPALELPAHNAPLGLDFYQGGNFPAEYQGDVFLALHGSWNRSIPDGYKVVRVLVEDGKPVRTEDFATGWLRGRRAWGRPVDVLSGPDGALYVSDDRADAVYRITYGE